MPIVASTIVSDARQIDGRRAIIEQHTDQLGIVYPIFWTADAGTDATAAMSARAPTLNVDLTAREIAANLAQVATLGSLATPAFNYSTVAQNVAALRLAYATATQVQAIMTGDYLASLTDTQLQSAFGLTAAQVTSLRAAKLTPAANAAATIRAAAGA